jgi:hypothetical protein
MDYEVEVTPDGQQVFEEKIQEFADNADLSEGDTLTVRQEVADGAVVDGVEMDSIGAAEALIELVKSTQASEGGFDLGISHISMRIREE